MLYSCGKRIIAVVVGVEMVQRAILIENYRPGHPLRSQLHGDADDGL
jgi:hypothetical protein